MAAFDNLAGQTFTTIIDLMGENAVWHTSNKRKISGRVLFKNPTEPIQIGDSEKYEYRPNSITIEYFEGTFPGLKKLVDKGKREYITVNSKKYCILEVTTKFDGKTYTAHGELHKDEPL